MMSLAHQYELSVAMEADIYKVIASEHGRHLDGHTAPRTAAMDTFRWGSGGTSLGEWEHNNNSMADSCITN